jgi:hypothetical protein
MRNRLLALAGCAVAMLALPAHADPAPCDPLPFAASSPVPEASAATWLQVDGRLALMVVGDSGNHGAYELLDPDDGTVREHGELPLGDAGDDLEGLSARGDLIFGLTSAGWMRAWKRTATGFALVAGPYPIGEVDPSLPDNGHLGNHPPAGDGMVCGARGVNCGRNYEGLCLVPPAHAAGPCAGFAAAKADGHLYCLVEHDGKLIADHARALAIDSPGTIADCTFDDAGRLWVGDNTFGLNQIYRIDGWAALATAKVVPVVKLGIGFPEVLAVRGDIVYRMSDLGGAPSLMAKWRCHRLAQ